MRGKPKRLPPVRLASLPLVVTAASSPYCQCISHLLLHRPLAAALALVLPFLVRHSITNLLLHHPLAASILYSASAFVCCLLLLYPLVFRCPLAATSLAAALHKSLAFPLPIFCHVINLLLHHLLTFQPLLLHYLLASALTCRCFTHLLLVVSTNSPPPLPRQNRVSNHHGCSTA